MYIDIHVCMYTYVYVYTYFVLINPPMPYITSSPLQILRGFASCLNFASQERPHKAPPIRMYAYIITHTHTHTHTFIHTHTHTHTFIHTHTHTHTLCRLKHGKGSMMAIFDATNTTRERRRRVLERVMKEPGVSGNTQL